MAFLRKSLLFFFSEIVTAIALICVLFGTNLFYYTYSWGELPHSYLFSLFSMFIFCILKLLAGGHYKYLMWSGFLAGFITLIRPTGVIILLFPLLFNVYSWHDFTARSRFFMRSKRTFVISILLFWLPLAAQMLVWKINVGKFVYYSYGNERFFFNDPQILNFLFSFRKGWLVYTPIMSFALIGMLICRQNLRSFFFFNLVFFFLVIYILSSWWEWSYGGSFGCRALVEYYSFFAFPLAAFISWFWYNPLTNTFLHTAAKVLPIVFFYLLLQTNVS
jgi:hypothetical protein